MNTKKLLNKRLVKLTVGDLKKALKGVPNDREVILSFMMKDEGIHNVYLGEVFTDLKYDAVIKERLYDSKVVNLQGYSDKYCTYLEREDEV